MRMECFSSWKCWYRTTHQGLVLLQGRLAARSENGAATVAAGGKMGMTCLASMLAQTLGVLFCLSGRLPLTAEMEQSQLHIMRLID